MKLAEMAVFGPKIPEMTFLSVLFSFLTASHDPWGFRGSETQKKPLTTGHFIKNRHFLTENDDLGLTLRFSTTVYTQVFL